MTSGIKRIRTVYIGFLKLQLRISFVISCKSYNSELHIASTFSIIQILVCKISSQRLRWHCILRQNPEVENQYQQSWIFRTRFQSHDRKYFRNENLSLNSPQNPKLVPSIQFNIRIGPRYYILPFNNRIGFFFSQLNKRIRSLGYIYGTNPMQ